MSEYLFHNYRTFCKFLSEFFVDLSIKMLYDRNGASFDWNKVTQHDGDGV